MRLGDSSGMLTGWSRPKPTIADFLNCQVYYDATDESILARCAPSCLGQRRPLVGKSLRDTCAACAFAQLRSRLSGAIDAIRPGGWFSRPPSNVAARQYQRGQKGTCIAPQDSAACREPSVRQYPRRTDRQHIRGFRAVPFRALEAQGSASRPL